MLFSEDFLEKIKNDPTQGGIELIKLAQSRLIQDTPEWQESDHIVLLESYSLIMELIEAKLIGAEKPGFQIIGEPRQDCININAYLTSVENYLTSEFSKSQVASFRSRFKTVLSSDFSYEFTQGDLSRIQELINQIRDFIAQSEDLEKDHQRRLLARLEKLQSELHKKISDLDRFWGLIGDAGIVLGKLGNDAKPMVDRIKEIADIIWKTQARAEELPSGMQFPMLSNKINQHDK